MVKFPDARIAAHADGKPDLAAAVPRARMANPTSPAFGTSSPPQKTNLPIGDNPSEVRAGPCSRAGPLGGGAPYPVIRAMV